MSPNSPQIDNCTICGNRNFGQTILYSFFCATCLGKDYSYCKYIAVKRDQRRAKQQTYYYILANPQVIPLFNQVQGGDPEVAEIRFTNGDTEDWVKLELRSLSKKDFDQVLGFIKLVIPNDARNWDSKRYCWFITTECVNALLDSGGLETFVGGLGNNVGYYAYGKIAILDKREKLESFDEFFNVPPPSSSAKPKTKSELIEKFNKLWFDTMLGSTSGLLDCMKLDEAKPYYRKLALAFHPDRNNGDGTKMSELNLIWNELKERF